MLAPLPKNLDDALRELGECSGIIDDKEYTPDQRDEMLKLQTLGLVQLSWRLTPAGKQRLEAEKK